ncbi:hypothetical protein BDD12DRAFT_854484, partial [Trichophaea hybrida]
MKIFVITKISSEPSCSIHWRRDEPTSYSSSFLAFFYTTPGQSVWKRYVTTKSRPNHRARYSICRQCS